MTTCALIVAAGGSQRFGGTVPKQFRQVCGRPLLSWTISRFQTASRIDQIVIVAAEEHLLYVSRQLVDSFGFDKVTKVIVGGETRRESVLKGLQALPVSTGYVAIHDGARALVSPADIDRVVEVAMRERAAMLAIPAADTVKRVKDGFILATLDRDSLYLAQTPQVFQYDLIMGAHQDASKDAAMTPVTDDAALIEAKGFKVKVVEPSGPNIKVTTQDDLKLVEALLKGECNEPA